MSARRACRVAVLGSLGVLLVAGALSPAVCGPQSADESDKSDGASAEGSSTAGSSKSESEETAPEKEPKGEKTTYTNEDLERMFGPAPDAPAKDAAAGQGKAPAPKGGAQTPDPLATIADEVAREEMRKKLTAEAQAEIAAKTAEVKKLEQRILRIKNPLLPRPEADMTPEEIGEWNGLSATERVAATEERLKKARAELSEAEAKLEKLESS